MSPGLLQFTTSALVSLIRKVQTVQNAASRLITGARRCDLIAPVLRQLHWLRVRRRVDYKVDRMSCSPVVVTYVPGEWHQPHHRRWSSFAPTSFRQDMRRVSAKEARVLRALVYGTASYHLLFASRHQLYEQFKRLLKTFSIILIREVVDHGASLSLLIALSDSHSSWNDVFLN